MEIRATFGCDQFADEPTIEKLFIYIRDDEYFYQYDLPMRDRYARAVAERINKYDEAVELLAEIQARYKVVKMGLGYDLPLQLDAFFKTGRDKRCYKRSMK
ncbi:MAG: hypothetical protein ABIH23_16865 [bacterium]